MKMPWDPFLRLSRKRPVEAPAPEIFFPLYGPLRNMRLTWPDLTSPPSHAPQEGEGGDAVVTIEGRSDRDGFAETRQCLSQMGLDPDLQDRVLALVAAVLHLGNVTFAEDEHDAAVVEEGKCIRVKVTEWPGHSRIDGGGGVH
jgi:hypothetical protein